MGWGEGWVRVRAKPEGESRGREFSLADAKSPSSLSPHPSFCDAPSLSNYEGQSTTATGSNYHDKEQMTTGASSTFPRQQKRFVLSSPRFVGYPPPCTLASASLPPLSCIVRRFTPWRRRRRRRRSGRGRGDEVHGVVLRDRDDSGVCPGKVR